MTYKQFEEFKGLQRIQLLKTKESHEGKENNLKHRSKKDPYKGVRMSLKKGYQQRRLLVSFEFFKPLPDVKKILKI